MSSTTLFELIMQGQKLVDAISNHQDYARLQESEHLVGLDVTLGDVETFLMQFLEALGQATEAQAGGGFLPSFEELFGENALSNSLSLLERRKLSLTEIMNRPLPPIDPKTEQELAELEDFFHGGNQS